MTERLLDPASGAHLSVPTGWRTVDDVGAVTCEGVAGQADATGRAVAAHISIQTLGSDGGLVPRAQTGPLVLGAVVRDVVQSALAADRTAWLIDSRPWPVRTAAGQTVDGMRVDVTHHDVSTPLVVSTIVVPDRRGLLTVTATVPVAHELSVRRPVEQALATLVVEGAEPGAGDVEAPAPRLRFAPCAASIEPTHLEVFVAGSHKIARVWRPQALAAGLVRADGVATGLGDYVRRAVSRPDARLDVEIRPLVHEHDVPPLVRLVVDRLGAYAVVRASRSPAEMTDDGWQGTGLGVGGTIGIEVVDLAAAPARAAAWLGLGPGRAIDLPAGLLAISTVTRSGPPGTPPQRSRTELSTLDGPRDVWRHVISALA